MVPKLRILSTLALAALLTGPVFADSLADLQAKFDQDHDAIHRARMISGLSSASFHSASQAFAQGNDADALKMIQRLRDDMQAASTALDQREKNPEGHPNGFKQLQVATREALSRLDEMMVGMLSDEQAPYAAIRKDIDALNRHLIRELFPPKNDPKTEPKNEPKTDPKTEPKP